MKKIKENLSLGLYFLLAMWIVMIINVFVNFQLNQFGIVPREVSVRSFVGIFLSSFIHADFNHLISNAVPLFILLVILSINYRRLIAKVILNSIFWEGLLVWLFARYGIHIGASGLIFALLGFIVFSGFLRATFRLFTISVVVGFIYGGLIWAILPDNPHISWEGHFSGLITGICLAYIFSNEAAVGNLKKN